MDNPGINMSKEFTRLHLSRVVNSLECLPHIQSYQKGLTDDCRVIQMPDATRKGIVQFRHKISRSDGPSNTSCGTKALQSGSVQFRRNSAGFDAGQRREEYQSPGLPECLWDLFSLPLLHPSTSIFFLSFFLALQ
jgi:hypothetical protein